MNLDLSNERCENVDNTVIGGPEKLGSSYEIELNDSMSSFESVGSWMAHPQNAVFGAPTPQTPPHSPSDLNNNVDRRALLTLSPLHTPRKNRIRGLVASAAGVVPSTPGSCSSPCAPASLGISPGKPPRPPLLKKRSRRGILRSTRTTNNSSRRSLLSSSQSSRSLTPTSGNRTPSSSGGRRRNRSFRHHRKRSSPFRIEKRVTFCLPDDSSAGTSVSGSLLLCDVETMETSLHIMDHWGNGACEDFGNRSCRIGLPFMDGLDSSDDEFALDDGDGSDEEGLPVTMENWFNSASELGCNFSSLDDEESLSEGCPTPPPDEPMEDGQELDVVDACTTPVARNVSVLPILDDVHETPVATNTQIDLLDQENEQSLSLPTMTPVPSKEDNSEGDDDGTKESPTCVLDFEVAIQAPKQDLNINDNGPDGSMDLEQCTERFASVQLDTDDIAVRDLGQRAVTRSFENYNNANSLASATPISLDPLAVPPPECRRVMMTRKAKEYGERVEISSDLETDGALKGMVVLPSPSRRSPTDRAYPNSPGSRAISMSPVGRMSPRHPGRGR